MRRCRTHGFWTRRLFQSTHPCGVRLSNRLDPAGAVQVSIHAPLRGATHDGVHQARYDWRVSIHAPLRGATRAGLDMSHGTLGFNPRTPAGCDSHLQAVIDGMAAFQSTHPCGVRQKHIVMVFHAVEVSIHAPLRGATLRTPIPLTRR